MESSTWVERAQGYLKEWPGKLMAFFRDPKAGVAALPVEGSWELPTTYALSSVVLGALITSALLMRFSFGVAVSTFVGQLILGSIGLAIGTLLINLILGAIGRNPGFYRTAHLTAMLAVLYPVSLLLNLVHPLLSVLLAAVPLYFLYHYALVAAQCSEKAAKTLVGVLGGLVLFGYVAPFLAFRSL